MSRRIYPAFLELATILSEVKLSESTPLPMRDPDKPLEFCIYTKDDPPTPSAVAPACHVPRCCVTASDAAQTDGANSNAHLHPYTERYQTYTLSHATVTTGSHRCLAQGLGRSLSGKANKGPVGAPGVPANEGLGDDGGLAVRSRSL